MRASIRLAVAALAVSTAVVPAIAAQAMPISMSHAVVAISHHRAAKTPDVLSPVITAASWYQPDPLCSTPLGCGFLPLPPISPYPKGTYHVGTAVGRQIARAFIAVHLSQLAGTAHGGTLTIPLDTATTDGSLDPQAAKVNVCITYQAVTDVEGGFDNPPSANCLPAASAKYVAKPTPRLVANLEPLGGKLAGAKGFALLPAAAAPTAAWQIAFKLPTAKAQAAQSPTLKLLVGDVAKTARPTPTGTPTHRSGTHGSGGSSTGLGGGSVVEPAPTLPPAVAQVPPDDTDPVVAAPAAKRGRFVTVGYQYPEIWLLPILALILVPFTLRALTRDLTRRR
jgi:hypothetical protein